MPAEALVLNGDEGRRDIVRQGLKVGGRSLLAAAHGNQRPVAIQIGHRRLAVDVVEGRGVWQAAGENGKEHHKEDPAPAAGHDAPVQDALQQVPLTLAVGAAL